MVVRWFLIKIGSKKAVVRAATGICNEQYSAVVTSVVEQQLDNRQPVDIHEIQQAVENQLMAGRSIQRSGSKLH